MSFNDLGLAEPILRAVNEQGYTSPTPIQQKAAPIVLEGSDLMASAQTGTGKTAAFTLPMLQLLSEGLPAKSNHARALVLTPTRELAAQVQENIQQYSQFLNLRTVVVFGGVKINPQMMALRKGADILVATPGRLLDLYQQRAIRFDALELLVLDEADRMLDMGFIHDIKRIQSLLPKDRQTLLFSATFSNDIRSLAKTMLRQPKEVDVAPKNSTAKTVRQKIYTVDKKRKTHLLIRLIQDQGWYQVLVFSRTKHGANRLVKDLNNSGIEAAAIHGNRSQSQRIRALNDFKKGKIGVLVATDIAARGIDIDLLPHVVNFDLPNVAEDYVHRIGRTGRAGSEGEAISLVSADEVDQLYDIERLIRRNIPREEVEGFEAKHAVPPSKSIDPNWKPKPKKKKKPKPAFAQDSQGNNRNSGTKNRNASAKSPSQKKAREGSLSHRKKSPQEKRTVNANNQRTAKPRRAATSN